MALGHASDVGVRNTAQARMLANLVRTALKLSVDLVRSREVVVEVDNRARVAVDGRRSVDSLEVLRRSAMIVLFETYICCVCELWIGSVFID